MLAELLWLPVVATHQLHCRALRGWELPSRSKKDQRVEWTMGRNLRWESGAEDYNNVDLRDLLHAVYGEVYHKGAAESCGARSAGIVQGAPRAPDFTGQDLLPCGWELMQAFGGQCPAAVC